MNVFLPKFLQKKVKNETVIKCVGTSDGMILSTEEDSIEAQPSISGLEEDSGSFIDPFGSNNSSFISESRCGIYPHCCSKHLIDSSYRNFTYPSGDEMMYRRLELLFKKYPGRPYKGCSKVNFVQEKHFENEKIDNIRNSVNRESLIPVNCTSPDESSNRSLRNHRVKCSVKSSIFEHNREQSSRLEINQHFMDSKSVDGKETNLARQPSNITTRSSQEIYYTAHSSIINSSEEISAPNLCCKQPNPKSPSTSYCTTCSNTSSRSYCDEIARLNPEFSHGSQSHDCFDSTKTSLNWNTTSHCDNASTISKTKLLQSYFDLKNAESDFITSLSNENTTSVNLTNEQFTNVSFLSDKDRNWSFLLADAKKTTASKINSNLDSYKRLMNKKFENCLANLGICSSELSQDDSVSWNMSKSVKSPNLYVSKLPRRRYQKPFSPLATDLGTLDKFTYLSSLDESESCIN